MPFDVPFLRRTVGYESFRWLYRQVVKYHHYPPPVLERAAYTPFSAVEKALYRSGRLSAKGLTLPNFIGIGAMKSGTTWLAGQLGHHPEVFVPEAKELHYLSWNFHRSMKYYSGWFDGCEGKVKGEFTVDYGGIPVRRIKFIRDVMPDLKLIYMMRNPIDRVWSHAKQELLFRTHRRYEDVRDWEFIRRFKLRNSRHYTMYLRDIDNWLSVFPREALYIGFYDYIKQCPERLLTEVFEHVGVSTDVDLSLFPTKEVFRGGEPAPPMPEKYREILEEMYADMIEEIYRRYGGPTAAWRCKDKTAVGQEQPVGS
jgi:hypothetical protein